MAIDGQSVGEPPSERLGDADLRGLRVAADVANEYL